jgi:phage terminase Nu1 subunit (DNA packaging protein)
METIVSNKVLSEILGVSGRTVRDLADKGVLVKSSHGKYEVLPSIHAYIKYKINLAVESLSKGDVDYLEARRRNELAKAQLAELDLAEKEGELIQVSTVENEAFTAGKKVKDGLCNIPDRISPLLAAESDKNKIYRMLTSEINQVLEVLVNEGKEEKIEFK